MIKITLDINKSLEENASLYYDKAKKIRKKIEGAKKTIIETQTKLAKLEKEKIKEDELNKVSLSKEPRMNTKLWYEKFRWFISSEGFLVIGGKDAATNEIIVKKHTIDGDLVFHTDMVGSPFFVIKSENKEIGRDTIRETADATVTFSKAWKIGLQNSSVFYCKPEQLTKEAPSGEYVPRGGFVTTGKLNYVENTVNCAVGVFDGKVMSGPVQAIKKNCKFYVEIEQGREKASSIAKYIQKKINCDIDDIIRTLPSGGYKIKH